MLILKIIGIIFIFLALVIAIEEYNKYCQNKYNFQFIKLSKMLGVGFGTFVFYMGYIWYIAKNSDPLNGIIIMLMASLFILYNFFMNFKKTTFLHGLFGTILQIISIPLFPILLIYHIIQDNKPDATVEVSKNIFGMEKHKIYYKNKE